VGEGEIQNSTDVAEREQREIKEIRELIEATNNYP
jgi:hypothetical protein